MRGPEGLVCFLTGTTSGGIHVVYEKNEKPSGPFMATRSPPAPGLIRVSLIIPTSCDEAAHLTNRALQAQNSLPKRTKYRIG